jgi:hypothetical protein
MTTSRSGARRVPTLIALALAAATLTCVDQPTDPRETEAVPVPPRAAAATSVVHTLLAAGGTAVNGKVCTTASISPTANALVTVAVLGHNGTAASPSPVVTGGGMAAWAPVATVTFDPVATPHKRISVFRALSASPGSGPIRITFTAPQANCEWIVSQWQGVETSGSNGSAAIAQVGSARSNAVTALTVTLGSFASASDVAYGIFGIRRSATGITPGAGFTEIAERASGETPPSDLQAEWAGGDNTVDARWTKLNAGALALEIKAAGGGTTTNPVASVLVTPDSTGVVLGDTVRLAAAPLDVGGEPLPRPVTWASANPAIATVSQGGLVTGVGLGTATITATSEGKSGTGRVTVTASEAPVATVQVAPASATIATDGSVQLTATPKDAAGHPLTGREIVWSTDAPGVASVSSDGLVNGVSAGGAIVTAASEGRQGTAAITVTTQTQSSLTGQWSSLKSSPIIQLHLHLLDDGRVLSWGHGGSPQVWDPATGGFTGVPSPAVLFCSGHTFLPDGRLLVAGGHITNNHGLPATTIFDPVSGGWQSGAPMAQGRWYPTTTTLPAGEVVVLSGENESGVIAAVPEVWNGSAWRQLTTASLSLPNYPRTFVAPDGRLFYAGSMKPSRWLDVSGTGQWTTGPSMAATSRLYGAAVMYRPGKILYAGGGNPPTNTAELIDLNQSSPQWTPTGSMGFARWNLNATLLPTGDVLVTGGTSLGDRTNPAGAVNVAELWSPASGQWTQLASSAPLLRGYHSTTLLLPDGRVLHTGGGDGGGVPNNYNYEIFSPPYLFKGARPVITGGVPDAASYGQTLAVATPDAGTVTQVSLIRLGSVTHAFDQSQTFVPLGFSPAADGLSVTLPSSRITAPPGPYMLFLVNGNGVPSVGRIVRLQ